MQINEKAKCRGTKKKHELPPPRNVNNDYETDGQ